MMDFIFVVFLFPLAAAPFVIVIATLLPWESND